MRKFYDKKLIVSGNVVELYEYEKPVLREPQSKRIGRAGQNGTTDEQKRQNRRKVAMRNRKHLRRIINANFSPRRSKFVTLTFEENITEIKEANKRFVSFRKRLARYLEVPLEYIAVPEFQKRGAVHYHMLMNCPYIPHEVLARLWGHGFVKINCIDSVDNLGAYVTKYMTKDNDEERLAGRKSYFASYNLKKPDETTDEEVINAAMSEMQVKRVACDTCFDTEYYGTVKYVQYVLEAPLDIRKHRRKPQSKCFPPLWADKFSPLPTFH